jgi:hypothetical protein
LNSGRLKEESSVDSIALAHKILEISRREFALVVEFRDGLTTGTAIRTPGEEETTLAGVDSGSRLVDGHEDQPNRR